MVEWADRITDISPEHIRVVIKEDRKMIQGDRGVVREMVTGDGNGI